MLLQTFSSKLTIYIIKNNKMLFNSKDWITTVSLISNGDVIRYNKN